MYTFQPSGSDAEGNTLTFAIDGKPDWALFNTSSGQLAGTPAAGDVGQTADITISVSDGKGGSASLAPFAITIMAAPASSPPPSSPTPPTTPPTTPPSNTPPTISGTPMTTVMAGATYSFQPTASDANHDTLTFTIANKPSWASFSSVSGALSGKPVTSNVGAFANIKISVSDGKASASLAVFMITVQAPPNQPPTISGSPATSVTAGFAYSFTPTAKDPDGNALTFAIQNKPSWATFSTSSGALTGTPSSAQVGSYANIIISVSDGKASVSLPAFAIAVAAPPSGSPSPPPSSTPTTISGTPGTTATVGSAYNFQPTASGSSGSTLTFSIQNKPSWATFNTSTGQLAGTPGGGDVGTVSGIAISVTDGKTSASLSAFQIVVSQIATGSASLSWVAPSTNVDGSTLSSFAGYKILYGTSPSALTQMVQIANPSVTTYAVSNLNSGTWYLSLVVYTSDGTQSTPTNPVSVSIP